MRILYIGDIVGNVGVEAVCKYLPKIKEELKLDFIIACAENSFFGFGATPNICKQLHNLGVDAITMGNHTFDMPEIIPWLNADKRIVRPLNLPLGTPGVGHTTITLPNGRKVLVVQFTGQLFYDEHNYCAFEAAREFFATHKLGEAADVIIVDIHAECTGEKIGFARVLDGKCTAVLGTHTHVPSSDYHIQKGGTAYQTDVGMVGDYDGIIGFQDKNALEYLEGKFRPSMLIVCDREASTTFCATYLETGANGLATKIAPVRLGGWLSQTTPKL